MKLYNRDMRNSQIGEAGPFPLARMSCKGLNRRLLLRCLGLGPTGI